MLIATILAGLIGLEREISGKPAGFRTQMLVGGASALLVILGKTVVDSFGDSVEIGSHVAADPIRIIQAIIVGVSFIGAGTVLKVEEKNRVRFLTTAASILFSAGVGVAVALELVILAVAVVVMVISINFLLGALSDKFPLGGED